MKKKMTARERASRALSQRAEVLVKDFEKRLHQQLAFVESSIRQRVKAAVADAVAEIVGELRRDSMQVYLQAEINRAVERDRLYGRPRTFEVVVENGAAKRVEVES